ncbi:MAG: hypothetical protein KDM64_16840, partial [Verrucomicrobiae bacterium]|nr:hypothetical protein [Verrucomicrobiae bacterium]
MFVLRCERPRALAAGIALLTMTGCYSYAPYGYNQPGVPGYYSSPPPGVYSQPGIYSQPAPYNAAPGTLGPGTSAPPPGGYPSGGYPSNSGSPTYNNNQPFQPGAIDGGPGDTYQPPSGYSPTPAEPFGADPRRAPVENLAPPVRDLEPSPRPRSSEPFGSDPANFGTRPGDNRYTPPPRTTTPRRTLPDDEPFGSDTRVEPPQEFVEPVVSASRPLTRMMVGPELKTPGAIVPAGGTQDAGAARPLTRATLTVPAVQHSNPYAHDRDGFTWLRGTVDFDEE